MLTPNPVEFSRLLKKEGIEPDPSGSDADLAKRLAKSLGGVTILQKGATDLISNGRDVIRGEVEGGLKRCGGQGDVLSGALGTLVSRPLSGALAMLTTTARRQLGWGKAYEDGVGRSGPQEIPSERIPLLAAYGASCITRTCSNRAFADQGRAMQTSDMLPKIGKAYEHLFGDDRSKL